MHEVFYNLGTTCLRWVDSFEPLATPIDHFTRIWQRHRKLRSRLRAINFDAVIDGGANIGEFAQIVRRALPAAEILCVEPHPGCAATLRKQGFRVVEAALWREAGRLDLLQPTAASTSCTVQISGVTPPVDAPTWNVAAIRLDDLEISGSRILLKLDLQGAEVEALQGMENLWPRCAGVLLEVSIGENGTYEQLRKLLSERGFAEYSTTNELEEGGRVIEADKLWLRPDDDPGKPHHA